MAKSVIVDTSALVALLFQEPESQKIAVVLAESDSIRMASPNLLETVIVVVTKRGSGGYIKLIDLLDYLNIEVVACDKSLTEIAIQAWHQYGKGRHPASLNFGDCFAYALSKQYSEPLLFKGNDFSQTDILVALV